MAFPGNELERLMQAASNGDTGVDSFLARLFETSAFFPIEPSAEGGGSMRVLTIDTRSYVALYTSADEAMIGAPGATLAEGPVRELLATLPAHLGIAVNPGGNLGLPIYAEAVQQYLHGSSTLSVGTRVRIGEPTEEPEPLLAKVAAGLGGLTGVREARRCWAQVGDADPGLVIGVDVDPDNPDTRAAVVRAIGAVTGHSPEEFAVNVVFTNDHDVFTQWMAQNAEPFFGRQDG
jgi:hypothetical protein